MSKIEERGKSQPALQHAKRVNVPSIKEAFILIVRGKVLFSWPYFGPCLHSRVKTELFFQRSRILSKGASHDLDFFAETYSPGGSN